MSAVKVSKRTGHRWITRPYTEDEKNKDEKFVSTVPTHRSRTGSAHCDTYVYCERCGWGKGLRHPPPDDWIKIIKAPPNCDLYMVRQVQDS
jgi:hypothetical protein